MSEHKKNIAVVVQRFGKEINGGAEMLARMYALLLQQNYNVTVVTSCAVDYVAWDPVLAPGEYEEDGLKIIRFANKKRVRGNKAHAAFKKAGGKSFFQKLSKAMGVKSTNAHAKEKAEKLSMQWIEMQGPVMPELVPFLKANYYNFDAFIYMTMAYYPSVMGVQTTGPKAVLIPTLHDEPISYFEIFQKVMASPAWLIFNVPAEQRIAQKIFSLDNVKQKVVSGGIELWGRATPASKSGIENYKIPGKYIIYAGRIDPVKGCDHLVDYFTRYIKTNHEICLVMVGKMAMTLPANDKIIYGGFVSDEDKKHLMQNAEALVIPSPYESLSLVLLESMAAYVPVIANKKCEVLKDHIEASGGGWLYENYDDFASAMDELLSNKEGRVQKGEAGFNYVAQNFSRESILSAFDEIISDIEKTNATKTVV